MTTANLPAIRTCRPAWNKGRVVGQKRPLLPKHVWAIRVRLELAERHRDLALFNLAIDSKLRGCDLVKLRVADVYAAGQVKDRASIIQSKTLKPVRFELTEGTRASLTTWLDDPMMIGSEYLWPGRFHGTRETVRLVTRVADEEMRGATVAGNASAFAKILNLSSVSVAPFPSDVMARLSSLAPEIMRTGTESDPQAAELYASLETFLRLTHPWSQVTDGAYLAARGWGHVVGPLGPGVPDRSWRRPVLCRPAPAFSWYRGVRCGLEADSQDNALHPLGVVPAEICGL